MFAARRPVPSVRSAACRAACRAALRGCPRGGLLASAGVLLLLLASTGAVNAQVVISVPGDEATIQDALTRASDGDIIEVAPGNYPEAVSLSGLDVVVRSTGGASVTTINATGLGQTAVSVAAFGPGTRLEGFTIRGGIAPPGPSWGGGMQIGGGSGTMVVKDCVITNNAAQSGGGVAVIVGASVAFEGCTIRGNQATSEGAGVFIYGSSASFTDCVIRKNTTGGTGGGLYAVLGSTLEMDDCRILRNTAGASGGGITANIGGGGSITLTGCRVEENEAAQAGGMVVNTSNVTITDCDFLNNVATTTAIASGGGLQAQGTQMLAVSNSRFTGNRGRTGGGVQLVAFTGTATITDCDFAANIATSEGGGLACAGNASGTIAGCSFSNNSAPDGGGVQNLAGTNLAIGTSFFCGNAPDDISGTYSDQGGNTDSAICNGWIDMGYSVQGSNGFPSLQGTGTLSVGQQGALTLTDARPGALAVLFVSFTAAPTPFFSGTLIPVPPQLELSLFTDGAGEIALPFVWPAGLPAGFDIYLQYGIDDPGALSGVALSNALWAESL